MYQTPQGNYQCSSCNSYGRCRSGGLEKIASNSVDYGKEEERKVFSYEINSGERDVYGVGIEHLEVSEYGKTNNNLLVNNNLKSYVNKTVFIFNNFNFINSSYSNNISLNNHFNPGIYHKTNFNLNHTYGNNKLIEDFLQKRVNKEYNFSPDDFLRPDRRKQRFVGKAEEIKELVEEAFKETTGLELPDDINIEVCPREKFRKMSNNPGVVGLSVNRKEERGVSDIFVLEEELDKVLLTTGHEIGHVLSRPLGDKKDEEAKAFAFSLIWMEAIKKKDIGGMGRNIELERPARNGVHDLALGFVLKMIKRGKKAGEVYKELAGKIISTENYFN